VWKTCCWFYITLFKHFFSLFSARVKIPRFLESSVCEFWMLGRACVKRSKGQKRHGKVDFPTKATEGQPAVLIWNYSITNSTLKIDFFSFVLRPWTVKLVSYMLLLKVVCALLFQSRFYTSPDPVFAKCMKKSDTEPRLEDLSSNLWTVGLGASIGAARRASYWKRDISSLVAC